MKVVPIVNGGPMLATRDAHLRFQNWALAEGFKKNFDVVWDSYKSVQAAIDKLTKTHGTDEATVDFFAGVKGSSFDQLQKDAAAMRAIAFSAFQVPTDVYWYAVNIAYASLTYVAVQLGAKSAA